jgi:hypothetical protein
MVSEPNVEPSELLVELRKEFDEQRDSDAAAGGRGESDRLFWGAPLMVLLFRRIGWAPTTRGATNSFV